ncbi:MAG TPA: amidohydrolase [Thermoanaerobaculia bacterium]|nr:amidohydrolase [Thermoanaerobaculia bacterium]
MRLSIPWLLLLLAAPATAQPLDPLIDKELPALVSLYQTIHETPELSHREEKTSALVAQELRSLGFTVVEHLGKYPRPEWTGYGVAGVLRNGTGPTVLIRAEMDALPVEEKTGLAYASREAGVMHACGHDLHTAAMIGTARMLVALKSRWKGTVVLVGQPAEETLDGARSLIEGGLFTQVPKPDYVLALHDTNDLAVGQVGITPGSALASAAVVEVTLRGKGGHASTPQNAKDPVVLAAQFILAVQTIISRESSPFAPSVITIGSVHGGAKANIIPEEVKLALSVRALDDDGRDRLIRAIERTARGIAEAAGVPEDRLPVVQVSDTEVVPATYNDPALAERLEKVFTALLGPGNVVRTGPSLAADDFANLERLDGRRIPSLLFSLGVADPQKLAEAKASGGALPSPHSPLFAPVAEPSLKVGVKAMTAAVLELLR